MLINIYLSIWLNGIEGKRCDYDDDENRNHAISKRSIEIKSECFHLIFIFALQWNMSNLPQYLFGLTFWLCYKFHDKITQTRCKQSFPYFWFNLNIDFKKSAYFSCLGISILCYIFGWEIRTFSANSSLLSAFLQTFCLFTSNFCAS